MSTPEQLIIAIDGGASNCRTILSTGTGRIIAKVSGGPANIRNDSKGSHRQIISCCENILKEAKLDTKYTIKDLSVYAGLAGAERIHLKKAFLELDWPFKNIEVYHDSVIALEASFSGTDGGVVIIGTGISACFKLQDKFHHILGYGFPFDDKGSGAWLGQRALQIALRSYEGLMPENLLGKMIMKHFNNDFTKAFNFANVAVSGDYASLVPYIWKCIDKGEPISHSLIEETVHEIENILATLEKKGIKQFVLVGGLSVRIIHWLSPYWQNICKEAVDDPLHGAYKLAVRRFNSH